MGTRRRLLARASAVAGAAGLAGCLGSLPFLGGDGGEFGDPGERPARQHVWNPYLRTDRHGNHLPPRYNRVLLLDLAEEPDDGTAEAVEAAMRTVEDAYDWRPEGLFHMLAWGSGYFERIGALERSPVRHPSVISRTDDPDLLSFDAALVLASDVGSHPLAVENAMFGDADELEGEPVDAPLGDVFDRVARRTGFIGEGLPSRHADAEGIPSDHTITEDDPLFTGFFSGRRGTQASEDRVTIPSGEFAGGTTMHLSHLDLELDRWFNAFDDAGRVARMFSPEMDPEDVAEFATDVPFTKDVAEVAAENDLVGHHEKVARVRRDGEPLLLRRDFNTVDGGNAGLHFLSLQRSLDEFVSTRDAMNGWWLRQHSDAITDRKNNGLLNFITVRSRANFYVPPREDRALPAR